MRGRLAIVACCWAWASAIHAADWKMEVPGSRLEFAATFEKTAAPGVFRDFDVRLRLYPDRPVDNRLEVSIRVTSVDMNSGDINNAIRGAEWFDFSRFPQAEFRATDIRRADQGRAGPQSSQSSYVARGTLSLKGIAKPVEVPFVLSLPDPAGTANMTGELTLKRSSFGIGSAEWAATNVIGADVRVRFAVKLRRND
jgi:polyisoprenoid-binding protein YceI